MFQIGFPLNFLSIFGAALIVFATSLTEAEELPYPPTYFSMFQVDLMVSKDVAKNCAAVEIDTKRFRELAKEQLLMIERDGFSRDNWRSEMQDIPIGLRDRPKVEFYMKWGVRPGRPESFCEAAQMEMRNEPGYPR